MAWGFDVSDMCQRGSRRAILENTPFSLFALKLHVDLNGDAGRFFKHRCHHTYLVSLKNGLKSEEIGGTDSGSNGFALYLSSPSAQLTKEERHQQQLQLDVFQLLYLLS